MSGGKFLQPRLSINAYYQPPPPPIPLDGTRTLSPTSPSSLPSPREPPPSPLPALPPRHPLPMPPRRRMMRTLTSSVRMMRRTMPRPSESRTSESLPTTRPRPQRPPRSSLPVRSSRSPSLSSPSRSSLGMMRPTWSLWRRKSGLLRRTVSYGVPPSSFPSVTVSPSSPLLGERH